MTNEEKNKQEYFLHVAYEYAAKNKLQMAALELLRQLNGSLISDIDGFFAYMKLEIGELNKRHPRCTALEYKHRDLHNNAGYGIDGIECVNAYLYPVIQKI